MARIRTIKPEFWTSEQVVECSPISRLLFIGIWNFCDDGGVIPASTKTIKMQVFPGDDFTASQVDEWLNELINSGLLTIGESESKKYYIVTGWHHQKIEKPSYKYPKFADHSPNSSRTLADHSPPEGKGRDIEGKRKRKGKGSNTAVEKISPAWPQSDFIEIYDQFVKKEIGIPAKLDGVQIKSGRQIYTYLKNACKQKQGTDDHQVVLNSWRYILDRYHQWDHFHQDRTKLTEINSNIQNIAKTLKNGISQRKTAGTPATTDDDLRAIINHFYPD